MYNVNPMELIMQIRNGQNPQQLIMGILDQQAQSNPIYANLAQMAKEGRTTEIEAFARNLAKERGLDFDKEFNAFRQMFLGVKK